MLTLACNNKRYLCFKNNSECSKELSKKEYSNPVNKCQEVTKADYKITKYSNKFIRKYGIIYFQEMLCPGKCPKRGCFI